MKIKLNEPPRKFKVGVSKGIEMKDCGRITLDSNEQVTFISDSGSEYDVARKEWGYYATPSLNGRLPEFGLRPALIVNKSTGRFFVLLVEKKQMAAFDQYLAEEKLTVLHWLDQPDTLEKIASLK